MGPFYLGFILSYLISSGYIGLAWGLHPLVYWITLVTTIYSALGYIGLPWGLHHLVDWITMRPGVLRAVGNGGLSSMDCYFACRLLVGHWRLTHICKAFYLLLQLF